MKKNNLNFSISQFLNFSISLRRLKPAATIILLTAYCLLFISCGNKKGSSTALPGIYVTQYDYPYDLALNRTTERLYVSNNVSAKVYEIDTETNRILRTFSVPARPWRMAFSEDKSKLYIIHTERKTMITPPDVEAIISEITLSNGTVTTRANHPKDSCYPVDIAVASDAIFVSCYGKDGSGYDSKLYLFKPSTDFLPYTSTPTKKIEPPRYKTSYFLGLAPNVDKSSVYAAYSGLEIKSEFVCTGTCDTTCDSYCKTKCAYDCTGASDPNQCKLDCYDESMRTGTCWDECSGNNGTYEETQNTYYKVYEYSAADGSKVKEFDITNKCTEPTNLVLNQSGTKMFIICGGSSNVFVRDPIVEPKVDPSSATITLTGSKPLDLTLSPEEAYLFVTDPREDINLNTGKLNNGKVYKISTSDNTLSATYDSARYPAGIVADSDNVYIANCVDNFIHIIKQ